MVRFHSLCNFHIYKVFGCSDDGDITVFSYRSRRLVVMNCVFPCVQVPWVCSVVLDSYTLKGCCPHDSCSNSGGSENYSLFLDIF